MATNISMATPQQQGTLKWQLQSTWDTTWLHETFHANVLFYNDQMPVNTEGKQAFVISPMVVNSTGINSLHSTNLNKA